MSFFKRRKVRKFAEKAVEHKSSIFVFGSNIFCEAFIDRLIEIGAESTVSLISDKTLGWIDEIKNRVNVLIEERAEEYSKRNLYENIGFQNAEKVIILHEDPVIIQDIFSYLPEDKNLKVILLAQFAPPFVQYLSGQKKGQIIVVDNLYEIVRELYNQMDLSLSKPPVIDIPVPEKYINKTIEDLKISNVKILRLYRESYKKVLLPLDEITEDGDRILLYLKSGDESLRSLVDFYKEVEG